MMYGLQTRVSKEINPKLVKQWIKKDKSKRAHIRVKEFDNFKKLITSFMKKNFSYVSYVYGGFKEIHEQSLKFNIPLLNHDDNCYICRKNRKKTQKKGFFSKLFQRGFKENKNKPNAITDTNSNAQINQSEGENKNEVKKVEGANTHNGKEKHIVLGMKSQDIKADRKNFLKEKENELDLSIDHKDFNRMSKLILLN